MNSPSPDGGSQDKNKEGAHILRFGGRQVQWWIVLSAFAILATLLFAAFFVLNTSFLSREVVPVAPIQSLEKPFWASRKHRATDFLINRLKQCGLWKTQPPREVPRFFIESYPPDLNNIADIEVRKRVFLNSLLPHALLVRQEALQKRGRLEAILSKVDCPLEVIDFDAGPGSEDQCSWSDYLTENDMEFIGKLSRNYRTTTAEGLLERVDAVPTSIILAQGALESSWGSSRFTREGNSIFGMWTWNSEGIIPLRRDAGKTHRVKTYDNVLDAVRAYHLTLNRLDPYEEFRQLRRQTNDPLILVEGLTLYSERGEEYVEDIKSVILYNDLQKYDNCSLSESNLPDFSGSLTRPSSAAQSGKASL